VILVSVLGHLVPVDVIVGDDAAAAGATLIAAVGKLQGPNRPPVAASGTATVAITANNYGTVYNGGPLEIVSQRGAAGISAVASGDLAAGAGTEDYSSSLTALVSIRTPLLVSQFNDADGSTLALDDLLDHVVAKSTPQIQLWSALVTAKSESRTNLVTWADFFDDERSRPIGWDGMKHHPMAAAADYAAAISLTNNLILPRNGVVLKHMRAPAVASRFLKNDRIAALNGGLCPGKVVDEELVITRYVIGRYDLGVVDANSIDVLDYIAVTLAQDFAQLGPINVVPVGKDVKGDDKITLDGIQARVEDVLVRIQDEDGYLYDLEDNLNLIVTTYLGGGGVSVRIPKQCLRVVPGLHNVQVEGNHEVDAA
jgi:phage tail sheath gpL-like